MAMSDKGLISVKCKYLLQINKKNINDATDVKADNMNRKFTDERTQIVIKPIKRCFVSLVVREM